MSAQLYTAALRVSMVDCLLWYAGTAMVTCYEFLKRNCALPADDPETSDNTDQLALS